MLLALGEWNSGIIFEEISIYNMWINCWIARNIGKVDRLWVTLNLNSSIKYHIWLADPNFFLLSHNPSGTPSIWENNIEVQV